MICKLGIKVRDEVHLGDYLVDLFVLAVTFPTLNFDRELFLIKRLVLSNNIHWSSS